MKRIILIGFLLYWPGNGFTFLEKQQPASFSVTTVDSQAHGQRRCSSTNWETLFPDEEWNNFPRYHLQRFTGILRYRSPKHHPDSLQRYNPYKLEMTDRDQQTVDVYCGSSHALSPYVGKTVELEGKLTVFTLEGQIFTEIWPTRIRLAQ